MYKYISTCTCVLYVYRYVHTYRQCRTYIHVHTPVHKYMYKYISTCTYYTDIHTYIPQVKFGEPPSTDSEDFFTSVAVFLKQFQRIHRELFPPPKPSPRVQRPRYIHVHI